MNCLNVFFAQNDEIIINQTSGFPVISFIIRKKSELYVVRDVEIPNQLSDEGWLRSRGGSLPTVFLEAIVERLDEEILQKRNSKDEEKQKTYREFKKLGLE